MQKCIYERSVYLTAICFINVFCMNTNDVHNKNTAKLGYNEVTGTQEITSLYPEFVITVLEID